MYKVDNAIIMAAGLSSRFAPISYEYPKALIKVKGEVLIERQIEQLKAKGIHDITIVVGYKKELFAYLAKKYQVSIVENPEFNTRNNHSSLYQVRKKLKNTYICSADNYFSINVFESQVEDSYYSAVYEEGPTDEWCLTIDGTDYIQGVHVGGENAWVMLGHVFFSEEFSKEFVSILESIYHLPETKPLLWESIYLNHINRLPMKLKKYDKEIIFEFDSLDELREFDSKFINYTGSNILKTISEKLNCQQADIINIQPIKEVNETIGFIFELAGNNFKYLYETSELSTP